MATPSAETNKQRDLVTRGSNEQSPFGKAVFVGLRMTDSLLQYGMLAHGIGSGLINAVGLRTLPQGLPAQTGISVVDGLGLSPYRLILLGMNFATLAKQVYWVLFVSGEPMFPGTAVIIAAFNGAINAFSTLMFMCASTSASANNEASFPQPSLIVGLALFFFGLSTELVAEVQRRNFKRDPKNKGKAYTGGLWSIVRHANYLGYSCWRAGFALANGGWTFGIGTASFFLYDFASRGIPVLDQYCSEKYGEQWAEFKRNTPYALIPGIW